MTDAWVALESDPERTWVVGVFLSESAAEAYVESRQGELRTLSVDGPHEIATESTPLAKPDTMPDTVGHGDLQGGQEVR